MATHLLVRLLLPALLLAAVPTARAQYVKSYTYFSNACDGVPDTMFAMSTATAGTCTPLACQAVTSGIHADAECDSSINPPTTAGYTGTVTYANQACTGTPTAVVAVRTGKCIGANNLRPFYGFLASISILITYVAACVIGWGLLRTTPSGAV